MKKFSTILSKIELFCQAAQEIRVLGPYRNGNKDRKIVILINPSGKKKTMSYPKYVYMKEKRMDLFQPFDLTIDHKNFDYTDNNMSNLEALPRDVHSANDTRRVELIKLKCTNCGKDFERSPRLLRDKSKKGCKGPFCSRSCSAKFFRGKDNKDRLDELQVQDYVTSTYYRRKNVQAFISHLIVKYS